jgi:quercetin dioxygenase-like cupin family protein
MREDARTGGFYGSPVLEGEVGRFHLAERLYRPGQTIPRHVHARPYVCFVVEGRYRERSSGATTECGPFTLLIHPAGASHSDRFEADPARLLMLELDATRGLALVLHGGRGRRLDAPRESARRTARRTRSSRKGSSRGSTRTGQRSAGSIRKSHSCRSSTGSRTISSARQHAHWIRWRVSKACNLRGAVRRVFLLRSSHRS